MCRIEEVNPEGLVVKSTSVELGNCPLSACVFCSLEVAHEMEGIRNDEANMVELANECRQLVVRGLFFFRSELISAVHTIQFFYGKGGVEGLGVAFPAKEDDFLF